MNTMWRRISSLILVVAMLITSLPANVFAGGQGDVLSIGRNQDGSYVVSNADGSEETLNNSELAETYPYGLFALDNSEYTVYEEGEEWITLRVHRLGGTKGKVSAILQYLPVIAEEEGGVWNDSYAISPDDIVIEVENPDPITAYQAWGFPEAPEAAGFGIIAADGVDNAGEPCKILSLDTQELPSAYSWYVLYEGYWEEIADASEATLPVSEEDIATYDFRCVFELDGEKYSTNSLNGEEYVKPEPEELPEMPDLIELNPETGFTVLELEEGRGMLVEIRFAEGENEKLIRIRAVDDSETELDEFATLTIVDCIGGTVGTSLNSASLRVVDNDADIDLPTALGFEISDVSADKSAGSVIITVSRTSGVLPVSVEWHTEDGSALAGTDYVAAEGRLNFADNKKAEIEIVLINDQIEDLEPRFFNVILGEVLGVDDAAVEPALCTVALINTNTSGELNLASVLYDVDAVDVSADLEEDDGVRVSPLEVGAVDQEVYDPARPGDNLIPYELDTQVWHYRNGDPIKFSAPSNVVNTSTDYFWSYYYHQSASVSSTGNKSKRVEVPNMYALYDGAAGTISGGAKFASGSDRFWYGVDEYTYTYFDSPFTGRLTCNPKSWRKNLKDYLQYDEYFYFDEYFDYKENHDSYFIIGTKKNDGKDSEHKVNAKAEVDFYRRTIYDHFTLDIYTANDKNIKNASGEPLFAQYEEPNYEGIINYIEVPQGQGGFGSQSYFYRDEKRSSGAQEYTLFYGMIYEGSTISIQLGETLLDCVGAGIYDEDGNLCISGTIDKGRRTVNFSNIILPPNGKYKIRLVMERKQEVRIDLSTSAHTNSDGKTYSDQAIRDAWNLFVGRIAGKKIDFGYSTRTNNLYERGTITQKSITLSNTLPAGLDQMGFMLPTNPGDTRSTPDKSHSMFYLKDGNLPADIQWIRFNLPKEDKIVINGMTYNGDEKIWLKTRNLTTNDLVFLYYHEDFLFTQRPMVPTIDTTALYFDGNGNGRLDGYWNDELGIFVLEKVDGFYDQFINMLGNQDYEETNFQPVYKDGKFYQYFIRPYYTANPVSLGVPPGKSVNERMQVVPNFITDISGSAFDSLSPEMKQYRAVVSGKTRLGSSSAPLDYSADNHPKYGGEASVYSYVDIPLGGDRNPTRQAEENDFTEVANFSSASAGRQIKAIARDETDDKNNTRRYKYYLGQTPYWDPALNGGNGGVAYKDNITTLIFFEGKAYYYDSLAGKRLGDAFFIWEPLYEGHLLKPFANPEGISIAHSLAGDNIPLAQGQTQYLKTDGTNETWTSEAPGSDLITIQQVKDAGYVVRGTGINERPVTRVFLTDPAEIAKINGYLGSMVDNDTFALVIQEQLKTTGDILNPAGVLDTLADDKKGADSVTHGFAGLYPDSSYLQQGSSKSNNGSADTEGNSAYEETESDFQPDLFAFSSEALSILGVEMSGYEIGITIGIPVFGVDNGGGSGSAANTFDDVGESWGRAKKFVNGIMDSVKSPGFTANGKTWPAQKYTAKERVQNAFSGLAGDDFQPGNLTSKSVEFGVSVQAAIILKYNHLDNRYVFHQASLGANISFEFRLQHRFSPAPVFYVYVQVSAGAYISTGLTRDRKPVLGSTDLDGIPGSSKALTLYERGSGTDTKPESYSFLLPYKAFEITFSGKLLIEYYSFMDKDGDGVFDGWTELGTKASGFKGGFISSDGSEAREVIAAEQDKFELDEPVIVVLTALGDDEAVKGEISEIYSIYTIEDVKDRFHWNGFQFDIEAGIELGFGAGVEVAKVEIFFHANIGVAFSLGYDYTHDKYGCSFDGFELTLGIGFRVVFLFFNYEQDLISYNLQYDSGSDTWSHSWSALGDKFGGNIGDLSAEVDLDGNGSIDCIIKPPERLRSKTYSNGLFAEDSELEDLAYETHAKDFMVSGYGTSSNAFKLQGDVGTGYEYKVVTVGSDNYVVVTGSYNSTDTVDGTQLMLYRLREADNKYGFVSPIAGNTTDAGVAVDGDGTGDLDFSVWAEGDIIHVAWVSYDSEYADPAEPNPVYSSGGEAMTAANFATIAPPQSGAIYSVTTGGAIIATGGAITITSGGAIVCDGVEMTYYNYDKNFPRPDTTIQYGPEANDLYDEWQLYFASYAYFEFDKTDNQQKLFRAAANTVLKHAIFDTKDSTATGFKNKTVVSACNGRYDFLPDSAAGALIYAQSVPFSKNALNARLAAYESYIDALTMPGTGNVVGGMSGTNADYVAATKAYRMAYQRAMLNIYGGNSKLTVASSDGTPLTNNEMYVSKHQAGDFGEAGRTSEILTNIEMTGIGAYYYLAYITQESYIDNSLASADICTISRLYLRRFSINDLNEVEWSDPYLLRSVVNYDNTGDKDGVYIGGQKRNYVDAYIGNLRFLNGKLGDSLPVNDEVFSPFDVNPEEFLVFEMNGDSYVIREASLEKIISQGKGTINSFFTAKQIYGDAAAKENLSSGKNEVVITTDADGNIAAVYTASVPNSMNNAIYVSYWDPGIGAWGAGVMLAMHQMDIYEQALADGLGPEETQEAYYAGTNLYKFSFSNLQVALGRKAALGTGSLETGGLETMEDGSVVETHDMSDLASALSELGYEYDSLETLSASKAEIAVLEDRLKAMGIEPGGNAAGSELLILTQGTMTALHKYTLPKTNSAGQAIDIFGNPVTAETPDDCKAYKTLVAPKKADDGTAEHGKMGVYAISYGKGGQKVGNVSIRFGFSDFSVGIRHYAQIKFTNVGDAAIRASQQNPVKVELKLHINDGSDTVLASWNVRENIGSGQSVTVSTGNDINSLCARLPQTLGLGDYFYITVKEDAGYVGAGAYSYSSAEDPGNRFNVDSKPDLGVEYLKASVTSVDSAGNAVIDIEFDATNRGNAGAEDVYVQFSYVSGYEVSETSISSADDPGILMPVYTPLDLTNSKLYVSQPKYITKGLETLADPQELQNGILRLGTDDSFYSREYYIKESEYKAELAKYYTTTETGGWAYGWYNGTKYYYNGSLYPSAYAAYTAGQEAMKGWSNAGNGYYYNNSYSGYDAAKAAADALRKKEYIKTAAEWAELPAEEQIFWHAKSDGSGREWYVPKGYGSYAEAEAAFNAAKNNQDDNIASSYCRTVSGIISAAPDMFNGNVSGSLNIRVEIFSNSSNADAPANGLHKSSHEDEYYDANNVRELAIEQASFISAPGKITLAMGNEHRIPVSIRTTTGKAPELKVLEIEDGADELSTLYFSADDDRDGIAGTVSGYINVVGNALGKGTIHIIDSATNTIYPIAYTVAEGGDGINIFNDDSTFTFYNSNGRPYNPDQPNQSWKFINTRDWTERHVEPYLGNLSVGSKNACFTFETKAGELSFDIIGEIEVTSSVFPGTWRLGVSEYGNGKNPPTQSTESIDFPNGGGPNTQANLTHTITVKVLSETAYLDILKQSYDVPYTPSNDTDSPGLYWSRSFPTAASVEDTESVAFTVYALDESGLQSLSAKLDGNNVGTVTRHSDSLWSISFSVGKDNKKILVTAQDTNGNSTTRSQDINWFAANVAAGQENYGKAPSLTGSIYKIYNDGATPNQDIYGPGNVSFTQNDRIAGNTVKFIMNTNGDTLSYRSYDRTSASFINSPDEEVLNNGYYIVRASEATYNTWSQKIYQVTCFESMPKVFVDAEDPVFEPDNSRTINWRVTIDDSEFQVLSMINKVSMNGLPLIENGNAEIFGGSEEVFYGGTYRFEAEDTSGKKNFRVCNINVPIDISDPDTISYNNPWGRRENGVSGHGSLSVDFGKIHGGNYVDENNNNNDGLALADYYALYDYVVLPKSECENKAMPDQEAFDAAGDYAWLDALAWRPAPKQGKDDWEDLTAAEDSSTDYVLIVRDRQNPNRYEDMAVFEFTLQDNSIIITSRSASTASSPGANDAEIYVSSDRGDTGAYEYAALPLREAPGSTPDNPVYIGKTVDDFKAAVWHSADPGGSGKTAALEGFGEGAYQIAVRSLVLQGGGETAAFASLKALATTLSEKKAALDRIEMEIDSAVETFAGDIASLAGDLKVALHELSLKEKNYKDLEDKLRKGIRGVTAEMVDNAKTEYDDALAESVRARDALKARLDGGLAPEDATRIAAELEDAAPLANYSELRTEILKELRGLFRTRKTAEEQARLDAANAAIATAQTNYDNKANDIAGKSAASYNANPVLWDSVVISSTLEINAGSETSLRLEPFRASSPSAADGYVKVTAMDGFSYDGSGNMYQFAVMPFASQGEPDYPNSADIADLGLIWLFADDVNGAPDLCTIKDLPSGRYVVFVRVVADPDVRDNYKVNEHIRGELADLRTVLDDAEEACGRTAVDARFLESRRLLEAYEESGSAVDKAAFLASFNSDAAVLNAFNEYENENSSDAAKTRKLGLFYTALRAYHQDQAEQAFEAARAAYNLKASEINQQINRAYAKQPGLWDSTSYASVFVGANSAAPSSIEESSENDGVVVFVFRPGFELSDDDISRILAVNAERTVKLITPRGTVIVPAGTLKDAQDVRDAVAGISGDDSGGTGSGGGTGGGTGGGSGGGGAISYDSGDGSGAIAPISEVTEDGAAYVYFGGRNYKYASVSSSYSDIEGHWGEEAILFVSDRGLFAGVGDGLFSPDTPMTRGMAVTVLYNLAGRPAVDGESPFSDVDPSAWYGDPVIWAEKLGIVSGVGEGKFAPDLTVTREQLVTMIFNFLKTYRLAGSTRGSLSNFPDCGDVAPYAREAFEFAVGNGIIVGNASGELIPKENATRAQVAAMFMNLIRYILKLGEK